MTCNSEMAAPLFALDALKKAQSGIESAIEKAVTDLRQKIIRYAVQSGAHFNPALHEELVAGGYRCVHNEPWDEYIASREIKKEMIRVWLDGTSETYGADDFDCAPERGEARDWRQS
jgi:hypothetical protein